MTSKMKSSSPKVSKKISKIDQVLGKLDKLDKVDQRLDKVDQRLAQHTAMLEDHRSKLSEQSLTLRQHKYAFQEINGRLIQLENNFNQFKEDLSNKIDSFAKITEEVRDEHTIAGHTLDRHETMLKAVNKKVGFAHLN